MAQLRDEGYCDEAIALERAEGMRLLEDGRIERELWPVVAVFAGCSWTYTSRGLAGAVPTGISSQEIESTARVLGIPRKDCPVLFGGVRRMVNAALPLLQPKEG